MAHQSTGLHPRKFAYVDAEMILSASPKAVSTHGETINIVAYFSADAAGDVAVKNGSDTIATLTAVPGGKVQIARSGYEFGGAELSLTVDTAALTAGSSQVSVF